MERLILLKIKILKFQEKLEKISFMIFYMEKHLKKSQIILMGIIIYNIILILVMDYLVWEMLLNN
jgi:hypothetical protein